MGQAPMFINFRPFNLDFSRVRANRAEQFRLQEELTKRNNDQRARARDLKLPDMEGRPNDTAEDTATALEGQRILIETLHKYPNTNYAVTTDEWKRGTRMLQEPYQPDAVAARKARLKGTESLRDTMEAKKNDPIQGNPFTQSGRMVPDPDDSTRFLSIGDAFDRANNDPRYTRRAKDHAYQLENTFTSTLNDFDKNMMERMRTTASNTLKRPINEILDPASRDRSLAEIAAQPDAPPELQFAFLVNGSRSYQTNEKQVKAGLNNVMSSLSDNDLYNIFQGYASTSDYQKHLKDFMKDGQIDQGLVYERMLGGNAFDTGLDLPGGKMKGSFAEMYLTNVANRFLSNSNETALNYSMLRDRKSGAAKENEGKTSDILHMFSGSQAEWKRDPNDPKKLVVAAQGEGFSKTEVPIAVAERKNGTVQLRQMVTEAVNQAMHPDRVPKEREKLGLPRHPGTVKPEGWVPTKVGDTHLATRRMVLPGGKMVNADLLRDAEVTGMKPVWQQRASVNDPATTDPDALAAGRVPAFATPRIDPETGDQLAPEISSVGSQSPNGWDRPTLVQQVELRIPEDVAEQLTDYAPESLENRSTPGRKLSTAGDFTDAGFLTRKQYDSLPQQERSKYWNWVTTSDGQMMFGDRSDRSATVETVPLIKQDAVLKETPITDERYMSRRGVSAKNEDGYVTITVDVLLDNDYLMDQSVMIDPKQTSAFPASTPPIQPPVVPPAYKDIVNRNIK